MLTLTPAHLRPPRNWYQGHISQGQKIHVDGLNIEVILDSQKTFNQLQHLAVELSSHIANVDGTYKSVEIRLGGLERDGVIYAKGYWRKNRYLSLYFPSHKGSRRMHQYVGCNPEKIIAAEAAMQRAIEYEELLGGVALLESVAEQCCSDLTSMISILKAAVASRR
jgi:hypothetical protein